MYSTKYEVLLYYKYIHLENPESEMKRQRELCELLQLKGRIIIATEGINGTVEGRIENTTHYRKALQQSEYFKDINFKRSIGTGNAFPKLSIRIRPEIVTSKIPSLDPSRITGAYITADELHTWFEQKKEFYIVDMRNEYEYQSGYFEGFIPSTIRNFFELPKVLPNITHLKNKVIVTVCTGGVRCEKASGFLLQNGFNQVYQLKDGIQSYIEKYPNKHFKGKLYVFDSRLTIGFHVDDPHHEVVGKCHHCGKATDTYVNCEYDVCHFHYIACAACKDAETSYYFCKKECKEKYLRTLIQKITNKKGNTLHKAVLKEFHKDHSVTV